MRDLLIVLPFAYLVDVVLVWAAVIVFNTWFRDTDKPLASYILEVVGACLLAGLIRLLQGVRRANWIWQSVAESRLVAHLIVSTLAGFIATYPYHEVVELTGSPSSSDNFYVGRIIALVSICVVLVSTYCVTTIVSQSRAALQDDEDIRAFTARAGSQRNAFQNRWYLHLAVVSALIVLIDLVAHQHRDLTFEMLALLAGVLMLFVLFNLCWSRRLKGNAYYNRPAERSAVGASKEL